MEVGDVPADYASETTDFLVAVAQASFTPTSSGFTLLAEVDFGPNYGIRPLYIRSRTNPTASGGLVRMNASDYVAWRNSANTGDLILEPDASGNLTWNGNVVGVVATPSAIISANTSLLTVISGSSIITLNPASPPAIVSGSNITVVSGSNTITVSSTVQPLVPNAILGSDFINVTSGTNTITIAADAIIGTANQITVTSGSNTVTVSLPSSVSGLTSIQATTVTGTAGQFGSSVSTQNVFTSVISGTQHATFGDTGTEDGGVNVNGTVYNSVLKTSDIGSPQEALIQMHRHSTSFSPTFLSTRSNSDTNAHGTVTAGQGVLTVVGAGWTGTHYDQAAAIDLKVDDTGSISSTSLPGQIDFRVCADGSTNPTSALTISNSKQSTFKGTVSGTTGQFAGVLSSQSLITGPLVASTATLTGALSGTTASFTTVTGTTGQFGGALSAQSATIAGATAYSCHWISTQSQSAVSSVVIPIPAGFTTYQLRIARFYPTSAPGHLLMDVSVDGGSTYLAGTNYQGSCFGSIGSSVIASGTVANTGVSEFYLDPPNTSGPGTGHFSSGIVDIKQISNRFQIGWDISFHEGGTGDYASIRGDGILAGSSSTVTHIRFRFHAGQNISNWNSVLYGFRSS